MIIDIYKGFVNELSDGKLIELMSGFVEGDGVSPETGLGTGLSNTCLILGSNSFVVSEFIIKNVRIRTNYILYIGFFSIK